MMSKIRSPQMIHCFFVFMLMLFFFGCAPKIVPTEKPESSIRFKRVVVIPFQNMAQSFGENVTVQCRLGNRFYTTGRVLEGADDMLTGKMESYIRSRTQLELIPSSQAEGAYADVVSKWGKDRSELELMVQVGQALGAEAVVVGKIYRFIDREGTDYSVKTPATVAFDVFLIHVGEARVVWNGHFDETQQSLSDNILNINMFFKRKGRWISAEEMAAEGLLDLLETFPAP